MKVDCFASREPSRIRTIRWCGAFLRIEFPPLVFLLKSSCLTQFNLVKNLLYLSIESEGDNFYPFGFFNVYPWGKVCMPFEFQNRRDCANLAVAKEWFWNSEFDGNSHTRMPIVNDDLEYWETRTAKDPGFMAREFDPIEYGVGIPAYHMWNFNYNCRMLGKCLKSPGGYFSAEEEYE